jgi:hypothetical protein
MHNGGWGRLQNAASFRDINWENTCTGRIYTFRRGGIYGANSNTMKTKILLSIAVVALITICHAESGGASGGTSGTGNGNSSTTPTTPPGGTPGQPMPTVPTPPPNAPQNPNPYNPNVPNAPGNGINGGNANGGGNNGNNNNNDKGYANTNSLPWTTDPTNHPNGNSQQPPANSQPPMR